MITQKQQNWLNHLSDSDVIRIFPYDAEAPNKFLKLKSQMETVLGRSYKIVLRGASSLGISGQGELDVYIPVLPEAFDNTIDAVKQVFGEPKSLYPLERARFVTYIEGTEATIFVMNDQSQGWLDGVRFEDYLKSHPEQLERYRVLKEDGDGLSGREYYRRKIEFINEILDIVE